MPIKDKADLQDRVLRYLKRTDIDDLVPDWIQFAGLRIDADCRLPEQEFRSTSLAVERYVGLPLDFMEMRNIQAEGRALEYITPERMDQIRQNTKGGQVRYYTIFDNQIELLPHPSAEAPYELEIFYFSRLPPLVADSDVNLVLAAHPQLYLYACLVEGMPFLEHQTGQATWATMYRDLVTLLNDRAEKGRFSGNSLHLRAI